jgi:hypothetical protein
MGKLYSSTVAQPPFYLAPIQTGYLGRNAFLPFLRSSLLSASPW